jgi:glutamate formiminotransferase/formiminotetrahydrofolate cyclodeaminase
VTLVECVPNFSEGRRPEVIAAIRTAIAEVPGVHLLDVSADPWHNRTVITFAAPPDAVVEGAFAGIRAARDLIDLTAHEGVHPRMGAADVVPFIPLEGCTLDDCAALAHSLGDRVGRELHVPVFLYERAATRQHRRSLADVRRGGFERLRAVIGSSPEHAPDYGPNRMHPTAGAVAIGARPLLIAFNAYLGPATNLPIAASIARAVRESSGGLPGVKALAFEVDKQAQLSMNLVDLDRTGLAAAFAAVHAEAARRRVDVTWTEVVGLLPERALWDAGAQALRLARFTPDLVLEHRLRQTVSAPGLDALLERIAAPTAAPGGGSVAAYVGAMAAALAAMVGGIAAKRQLGGAAATDAALDRLRRLARELLRLAEEDGEAYGRYMEARRTRTGVDAALLEASLVPLRIARAATDVAAAAADIARDGLPAAAADAATAALLADAVCAAAGLTTRVNLAALTDKREAPALAGEADALARNARGFALRAVAHAVPKE